MTKCAVFFCVALGTVPAWCSDIGTAVTGNLNFTNIGTANYFDPDNDFVPLSGYGNSDSCGTPLCTIRISASTPTFGYDDGVNAFSADFSSGNQFTLTDTLESFTGTNGFTMTFTDPAFTSALKASDTFANGGLTFFFSGHTLSLSYRLSTVNPTSTAVFNLGTVPEPSTWAVTLFGAAVLGLIVRRRASKQQALASRA